jgi:hypothetical protein
MSILELLGRLVILWTGALEYLHLLLQNVQVAVFSKLTLTAKKLLRRALCEVLDKDRAFAYMKRAPKNHKYWSLLASSNGAP